MREHDELSELNLSMQRLGAAQAAIAVFDDGTARLVHLGACGQPTAGNFAVYSPADMFTYIMLSQHERRIFHDFKKRFGGSTQRRAVA